MELNWSFYTRNNIILYCVLPEKSKTIHILNHKVSQNANFFQACAIRSVKRFNHIACQTDEPLLAEEEEVEVTQEEGPEDEGTDC